MYNDDHDNDNTNATGHLGAPLAEAHRRVGEWTGAFKGQRTSMKGFTPNIHGNMGLT